MPGNPLTDPNWASDLAATVERVVGAVRDRTTTNIVMVARGVVFGLLAGILGVFLFVVLLVALTRGIQSLLALAVEWPQAVYISYFVMGGICCLVGLLLMKRRRPSGA